MMPVEPKHTSEQIAKLIGYDSKTGKLWWKVSRGPLKAGTEITGDYVKVSGYQYVVGRVAWCIDKGEWPPLDRLIDHRNTIHADNRGDNLRLATPEQNAHNRAGRAFLAKGVYRRPRDSKCWAAKIMVGGKSIELGSYYTEEEAAEAYRQAALHYHGEFACLR